MTSAHIGRPLCHCWRHVGAAFTAAMAAMLSPPLPPSPLPLPLPQMSPSLPPPAPFLLLLLPLFGFLPSHCLCFRNRCLAPPLPLLAVNAIVTVSTAANRCPLLLPLQPLPLFLPLFLPQFLPLFSLVMFKILLRPSNILNIFVAVPCFFAGAAAPPPPS